MTLVLIVDDSEPNRKLERDILRNAGFETLESATGAEALMLARDHAPDVILMDLRLPDMDGAEVTLQLPVQLAVIDDEDDRHASILAACRSGS